MEIIKGETPALFVVIIACFFISNVRTAPYCVRTEDTTQCSVQEQSDFAALPTNTTKLHIYFTEDHTVTLGPGVFPVRPHLSELTVDLNHIRKDIQPGAFILLDGLTSLRFEDNDVYRPRRSKHLRAGIFSGMESITSLDLEQTGINKVDQGVFNNLPRLTLINLANNKLTSFPSNSFTNTTSLETLILSNNRLTGITDRTFEGLINLKELDLSENEIEILGLFSLGNLPALETLELSKNNLNSVGYGAFQGLGALETLNIQENDLKRVKSDMFRGLTSLVNLDISQNRLTQIDDLAFNDLINLQFLELYENKIKQFSPVTFKGLENLHFLDLYLNNLTELHENVFSDLGMLGSLHLHQANIQKVYKGTFNGLSQLTILTLQQNNMSSFPEGVLDTMPQLGFLDISGNPWDCNCEITWMHKWSDGHHVGTEMNTTCAGTTLALLQYARDNYYNCRRQPTTTTTIKTTSSIPPEKITQPTTHVVTTTSESDEETTLTDGGSGSKATANATVTDHERHVGGMDDNMMKIAIGAGAGGGFLLLLIIIIIICYCRCKKCAFWRPPPMPQPATPRTPEKEDKSWLTFYSPSKDQSSYIDPETGAFSNGMNGNPHNGFVAPGSKSYVNHGLHVDDVNNANHKAMERRAEEGGGGGPAVVAYGPQDPVNAVLHSYSHSVSDSGTHHIDNNLPDEEHMNDLNIWAGNESKKKKKDKRQSKDKKHKTSNVSSSDNENPYRDVYDGSTIALSDMAENSPTDDRGYHHDNYDNPPYNPGYIKPGHQEEFPMY